MVPIGTDAIGNGTLARVQLYESGQAASPDAGMQSEARRWRARSDGHIRSTPGKTKNMVERHTTDRAAGRNPG